MGTGLPPGVSAHHFGAVSSRPHQSVSSEILHVRGQHDKARVASWKACTETAMYSLPASEGFYAVKKHCLLGQKVLKLQLLPGLKKRWVPKRWVRSSTYAARRIFASGCTLASGHLQTPHRIWDGQLQKPCAPFSAFDSLRCLLLQHCLDGIEQLAGLRRILLLELAWSQRPRGNTTLQWPHERPHRQ